LKKIVQKTLGSSYKLVLYGSLASGIASKSSYDVDLTVITPLLEEKIEHRHVIELSILELLK